MPDIVDTLLAEARDAITRMRDAALEARRLHAQAELARHMRSTAAKTVTRPLDEAVALVSGEWMKAWGFDAAGYPEIATEMIQFTSAFCAHARAPLRETEGSIASAMAALDLAFGRIGTSLADQMAFRSECAHGWWEAVAPTPKEIAPPRRQMRAAAPGEPFWTAGAPPHCG